jgi:hypothetical protein
LNVYLTRKKAGMAGFTNVLSLFLKEWKMATEIGLKRFMKVRWVAFYHSGLYVV